MGKSEVGVSIFASCGDAMIAQTRLGDMLLEAGLLTAEQLKMALDFQKAVGGKLGAVIAKLGFIEDSVLCNFIAKQQNLPVVNLKELVIPENLVRRLPRKLVEKHCVLPIHYEDDVLTVATSDPYDLEALEELQLAVDHSILVHLAPRSQILNAIKEIFQGGGAVRLPEEKSKDELLRELEEPPKPAAPARVNPQMLREALIPLLISKGLITEQDLIQKARELEVRR
jgi:hypothetical protein